MKYIRIFEEFEPRFDIKHNTSPYKVLNTGQILHYRQIFRLKAEKDVKYASQILDTIEKNGGKASLRQWNVIQRTYHGGKYPVDY